MTRPTESPLISQTNHLGSKQIPYASSVNRFYESSSSGPIVAPRAVGFL